MTGVWVQGKEQDSVCVRDRGFTYGDGLFATMAVDARGQIAFLTEHLARLTQGALRLGFVWQASDALHLSLKRIAAANPHSCLKLQLTRGEGGRGYTPPAGALVTEVISLAPLPAHYPDWQQKGIALKISAIRLGKQPRLAGIKHLNRLEQVLIKAQPLPEGFDDWLVLDCDDLLLESSMANLFLLLPNEQGKLTAYSPAMNYSGVSGVMRQQLIVALLYQGIDVQLCPINTEMLQRARHLFISNSLLGLVDVIAVDQQSFELWPGSTPLRKALAIQL
ncbi:aminodeoxychorismate lyase [Shewanella algae]|uniref:aminodeoxychorismate lyase n=1 Tax=Shewanella algae TaxID=38313 RepID=UPI003999BA1F